MILDAFVLCMVAVSLLIGMLRGLVREIMTILALAGGTAAAWVFSPVIAPSIATWLGKPKDPLPPGTPEPQLLDILPYDLAGTIAAWTIIILVMIVLISLLSHLLAEAAKAAGLGPIDGALGALFGVARGLAIVLVLYIPVHLLLGDDARKAWFSGGSSYEALEAASVKLMPLLPDVVAQYHNPDTVSDGDQESTKPIPEDHFVPPQHSDDTPA